MWKAKTKVDLKTERVYPVFIQFSFGERCPHPWCREVKDYETMDQ
jgi:hypothetical protein